MGKVFHGELKVLHRLFKVLGTDLIHGVLHFTQRIPHLAGSDLFHELLNAHHLLQSLMRERTIFLQFFDEVLIILCDLINVLEEHLLLFQHALQLLFVFPTEIGVFEQLTSLLFKFFLQLTAFFQTSIQFLPILHVLTLDLAVNLFNGRKASTIFGSLTLLRRRRIVINLRPISDHIRGKELQKAEVPEILFIENLTIDDALKIDRLHLAAIELIHEPTVFEPKIVVRRDDERELHILIEDHIFRRQEEAYLRRHIRQNLDLLLFGTILSAQLIFQFDIISSGSVYSNLGDKTLTILRPKLFPRCIFKDHLSADHGHICIDPQRHLSADISLKIAIAHAIRTSRNARICRIVISSVPLSHDGHIKNAHIINRTFRHLILSIIFYVMLQFFKEIAVIIEAEFSPRFANAIE